MYSSGEFSINGYDFLTTFTESIAPEMQKLNSISL